ncbi:MAG: hypothetical protein AB1610_02560 [Nitrospirota bacterium]
MDELEKLKMLLQHWMEHNNEHAEAYRDWARKALSLGNREISEILDLFYYETRRLNKLFEKAIKKIS